MGDDGWRFGGTRRAFVRPDRLGRAGV